ncbi:SPFH domain-containing protein [Alteromonas pelagimontana]|uniref:SPFH domain-containing protein n=1 Tax=Alteromonas pelagimontana TaxID=1858656 RepID=A0A6M4M8N2_9ALTE|nr:SPFH domain-containing protein [Alteromonas pelagimontana]QJR79552.1 SPFH domain-containing protein [Alteromonas pelagimontana]
MNEKQGFSINGYIMALVLLPVAQLATVYWLLQSGGVAPAIAVIIITLLWCGFFMVQPNQGKVFTLFGSYVGTERNTGLRWTIPLFLRRTVSLRIRNFESAKMKVNDNQGNPIEIAAIIVWSVSDTAEAVFEVDDYESYVTIQSESAIRNMASSFPYDPRDDEEAEVALRSHPIEISSRLQQEIQDRLSRAGITVHEARISHLAYAQEIASAMLQRQQAAAIIAARSKIVEGAVGMVEMALAKLSEQQIVELDEERKAHMVSNLLVVLCGDKAAQPIINSGSLY